MFIVKPGANILDMLKSKGHTSYTIRRDKTFGEATMQKFRKGGLPSWQELFKLCTLLHKTPCDLIAIQLDDGAIYDLTGKIRLDKPTAMANDAAQYDEDGEEIMPDFLRY